MEYDLKRSDLQRPSWNMAGNVHGVIRRMQSLRVEMSTRQVGSIIENNGIALYVNNSQALM
jgi:hypothetical protein